MRTIARAVTLLAAAWASAAYAQRIRPRDVDALPATAPTLIQAYGSAAAQFGELRMPDGKGPFPVAVVIHGGCWTKGFATARNTAAVASALAKKGLATWNIEYRQVGEDGAGWPGTFLDWGTGTDHLRVLARSYPLDLTNVIVVGHSAGAHAALFIASRPRLPANSQIRGVDPLPVKAAVAIDGPGDLRPFVGVDAEICGKPVIEPLMGGKSDALKLRYEQASPAAHFPLGVRQALISSSRVLSPTAAETYRAAAAAAGDKVDVRVFADSGHFEPIAPGTREWRSTESVILDMVRDRDEFSQSNADLPSTMASWLTAFNDLDLERFLQFFSSEATVFAPGSEGVREGRRVEPPALRQYWATTFQGLRQRSSAKNAPFLTIKPYQLKIDTLGEGGAVATFQLSEEPWPNRRTIVWRNEHDGWRIVHLHASRLPQPAQPSP